MKRYCLVVRIDPISKATAVKLKNRLDEFMVYDRKNPELVISIGGDGTMLESVDRYGLTDACFIGVHTGTLGFFTDYQQEELDELVADLKNEEYSIAEYNLLEVKVQGNEEKVLYALNEMRFEKGFKTQVIDVYVNDEFLETFRGDGLCVATSLGSTAYNKSVGGAVIYPGYPLMQLSEIAGIHNNAYRSLASPLVLDENQTIKLIGGSFGDLNIAIDHKSYHFEGIKSIDIKISKQTIKFAQYRNRSFIRRIRKAFIT